VSQTYFPPVTISPVLITRWTVNNQTLSKQSIYPPSSSQPVLTGVEAWEWNRLNHVLSLRWKIDGIWEAFVFELGNS
jgi:hypothetical protein